MQGSHEQLEGIPRRDLTTFGVVIVPPDRYLIAAIGGGTIGTQPGSQVRFTYISLRGMAPALPEGFMSEVMNL